jgi:hypothetical protein
MTIRYLTSGESHGPVLTAILEGLPSGVPITEEEINLDLSRRQHTFGRGERQQYIEDDKVKIVGGVRFGETLGSPLTLTVKSKEGWLEIGGAGMVHPNVLKECGVDTKKYSGFAFGWGVERTYMMKSGLSVPDIRLLYSSDLRVLKQI